MGVRGVWGRCLGGVYGGVWECLGVSKRCLVECLGGLGLGGAWGESGGCLGEVWGVSGGCLVSIWCVSGGRSWTGLGGKWSARKFLRILGLLYIKIDPNNTRTHWKTSCHEIYMSEAPQDPF